MNNYIQLNCRYYKILLRLRRWKSLATDYYRHDLIVPIEVITEIEKIKKEIAKIEVVLNQREEMYNELFPIDLVMNMINTGVSINI